MSNTLDFLNILGLNDAPLMGAYGAEPLNCSGGNLDSVSPTNGEKIASLKMATAADYDTLLKEVHSNFNRWRMTPAPLRGEVVRKMTNALREYKRPLGQLVAYEMGKILPEGEGEVQEMIDIGDFAVGLSRQLCGLAMKSERPMHSMFEQWQPLGCVGIISAFNFPVAVWAWNAFLAAICGDVSIWKPSPKTPLTGIAVHNIINKVLLDAGFAGIMGLVIGEDQEVGETLIRDSRVPLISATGSTRMGRHVGQVVAERFGKTILELGGNNALIIMDDADLNLAIPAVVFGAVGTAGQRCTSTRRLIVQEGVADAVITKLLSAYTQVRIGDPLLPDTLMGPLIDNDAVAQMQRALETAKAQGGEVLYGGACLDGDAYKGGCYVQPAIVRISKDAAICQTETFAPILYVMTVKDLDEAISTQNNVPQGLSSAIFTDSVRTSQRFLSASGSDCGIANVNIGTSGAEIGGAFGGEKETGGGRESGSDAWKGYMRRQTQTVNWSTELPLAQGIKFGQ